MTALLALCALATLALSGCSSTGEAENQAYALVLGIDGTEDGGVELTMRIPRIGHTGAAGGEGASADARYMVISAGGESYAQALEHLQWATARELNLSHVKLIVASEAVASGDAFPELIDAVAQTRHLYTTAGLIVCEGKARTFIEGQETILGTRLSSEIVAMFRHYAAHGYIPRATFADLYCATRSDYSDPTGIWGFMDAGEGSAESRSAAAIIADEEDRLNAETTTASSRQYLGTALFREGCLAGKLDARDTLYLNLLTGRVQAFSFACGGRDYIFSTLRGPVRRVDIDGNAVRLSASVTLTSEKTESRQGLAQAEAALSRELEALVRRCQAIRVEPFGFAERAAARFATLDAWRDFRWRDRYARAAVDVTVHID